MKKKLSKEMDELTRKRDDIDELGTSEKAAKGLVKISVQRLIEPILTEMERDI